MAKSKGKRHGAKHRARAASGRFAARKNPPAHKRASSRPRARHRRNPPTARTMFRELPGTIARTGIRAVEATSGVILARKIRGLAKQQPGTVVGSAIEILTGVGAGLGLVFVNEDLAEHVMLGCFMAPIMSIVHGLNVPHLSDSLGDDGALIGPGTGLTLVSAYPEDGSGNALAELPSSTGEDLGQWVPGDQSSGAVATPPEMLGDSWVTGNAA